MSGFTESNIQTLDHIKTEMSQIFTYASDEETHHLADYWSDDQVLLPSVLHNAPLRDDCDGYAMVSMHKAIDAGFKARLVVCLDETGAGHCICEVVCSDGTQAYYFDNRRKELATRQALVGYQFYSVSPWNPVPGDKRPWSLVSYSAR